MYDIEALCEDTCQEKSPVITIDGLWVEKDVVKLQHILAA